MEWKCWVSDVPGLSWVEFRWVKLLPPTPRKQITNLLSLKSLNPLTIYPLYFFCFSINQFNLIQCHHNYYRIIVIIIIIIVVKIQVRESQSQQSHIRPSQPHHNILGFCLVVLLSRGKCLRGCRGGERSTVKWSRKVIIQYSTNGIWNNLKLYRIIWNWKCHENNVIRLVTFQW